MRTATELAEMINARVDTAMAALTEKDIGAYRYLETHYATTNVYTDVEYRRRFRGFYRMRFTSKDYIDRFFELFEQQKKVSLPFAEMSMTLYPVDRKHQLSFISKLLHTTDNSHPIFDSRICAAFDMNRHPGTIQERIEEDERLLAHMRHSYQEMESQGLIARAICAFDAKFPVNGISFTKKADFVLWKLG